MRLIYLFFVLVLLFAGGALAQAPNVTPVASNPIGGVGVPTRGIYCMDANGNATVCSFGGSGGSGGAVTQSGTWQVNLGYNGAVVGPANALGVQDLQLDALISGGKLPVSIANLPALPAGTNAIGAVTQSGTWQVNLGYNGAAVSPANALGVQDLQLDGLISGGKLPVSIASLPALPAGTNAIGTVISVPRTAAISTAGCTVGTSSATCIAAGAATNSLFIQNTSAGASIACSETGTAVLNSSASLQLSPGASMLYPPAAIPTAALSCIASAASTPLYVRYN